MSNAAPAAEPAQPAVNPKVFVSYSWTDQEHVDRVLAWCERLVSDGVDVVIDKWVLSEGHDKFAFMESMVTDPSISHVLVFSDAAYAAKADSREKGVGTESQIISAEVYGRTKQDKFLPIICEFDGRGEPCLPVFLKGRIYFDFSSVEAANQSWERLIRRVYGKPLYVKPQLGKTPGYISAPAAPASLTAGKFLTMNDALRRGTPNATLAIHDFTDAVVEQFELHRIPLPETGLDDYAQKIRDSVEAMRPLRDELVQAFALVFETRPADEAIEIVTGLLERLLAFKFRPENVQSFNRYWWDNYGFILYELFLYLVAVLIRQRRLETLAALFQHHYVVPETAQFNAEPMAKFDVFRFYSEALGEINQRVQPSRISIEADLIKTRATLSSFPMPALIEADLLICLRSLMHLEEQDIWSPVTIIYAGYGRKFMLFTRAQQKRVFSKLAIALGVQSKADLGQRLESAEPCVKRLSWLTQRIPISFRNVIGFDKFDTLEG